MALNVGSGLWPPLNVGAQAGGAPTPEQVFSATFADVSGRDPLPTALGQRSPAANLVNYQVGLYLFNPQFMVETFHIEPEEFDLIEPGSMIWFKQDPENPMLSDGGRWAQIQDRRGTGAPGVVEVLVRISDNDESFVEP